ncbi:MAG TPA: magnesium-translocating P-type ATPase [Anaerolineaceae bacterium]|nr:magnesium-translocating P-type ATPase [Anaerolineaceae bacterium]
MTPANKQIETTSSPWALPIDTLYEQLQTSPQGLKGEEAQARLRLYGRNKLVSQQKETPLRLFLDQFKSPLILILVFAAVIAWLTGDMMDAIIVLAILFFSAVLGFIQEYRASNAMEQLRSRVAHKTNVLRDGAPQTIPTEEVVPGDIVLLSAGSLIPADGIVIQSDYCFVNQAVLTGETFPAEKKPGQMPATASLADLTNCVFMGTNVRSGSARAVIFRTGDQTAFGQIADKLAVQAPETEFQRGIREFGIMITRVMIVIVLVIFVLNVLLKKPVLDSLMFSVALAVGLAPEMLPAIINITLSTGAQAMAKRGVIVRKLDSIENFGSMDVLCTDKTGTLTLGVVRLDDALDPQGQKSEEVSRLAYYNAYFQTGLTNPLDDAILETVSKPEMEHIKKVEEIPYDFVRKRLSIAIQHTTLPGQSYTLITKGALDKVLEVCSGVRSDGGSVPLDAARLDSIRSCFTQWSDQGYRVLGLAMKEVPPQDDYSVEAECDMTFTGFLLFFDPPKPDVQQTIQDLQKAGVQLKIITGDNWRVTQHIAQATGMPPSAILTGAELNKMAEEALWQRAETVHLFAEVDPDQKNRIILALHNHQHVVGYMGDGINDAPALHTADVGISVDNAVDVAKEAADFVLLEHSLNVLLQGIEEGRKTFANTMKYICYTESANFGNMFSMAILSPFLSFLPLLPKQILLNNFLSDFPSMTVATDNVDPEMIEKPRRWNIDFIRNFMVSFGLFSSVFDFLTFGLLLLVLKVSVDQFRTGWFIESLLTELFVFLVIRTSRPFLRSRPGTLLLVSTFLVGLITLILPYLPWMQRAFGFVPLPPYVMILLLAMTLVYIAGNEVVKIYFYRYNSF